MEEEDQLDFEVQLEEQEEEEQEPEGETEGQDEAEQYSAKVQKRIDELTARYHEERRQREAFESQLDEAVRVAKVSVEEANRLKNLVSQGEQVLLNESKKGLEAQLKQAQDAWRKAFDAQDADAMANAQTEISKLTAQMERMTGYKPQPIEPTQLPEDFGRPKPQPDTKAQEWHRRNPWFQKDDVMTAAAIGLHQQLVKEGVDPRSDTYYERIDNEMRKRFPEKFQGGEEQQEQQGQSKVLVAPATRGSKSPKKVTLTKSQLAIARRLGITPEQYAQELIKESNSG